MKNELFIRLEEFEESEKYWWDKLSGELRSARLPGDFTHTGKYEKAEYRVTFGNHLEEKLAYISKSSDLSLYIILLTAFKILLFKQARQNDIIVVSPIYTSSNQEYNKFVALRDLVHPRMTFKELLMEVKQTVVEGYKNEHYPIEKLIQNLELEDNSMLFRNIFLYSQIHSIKFINEVLDDSVNDIVFSIIRNHEDLLEGEITYNAGLFKKETIQRLFDWYLRILSQVLEETGLEISAIELMTEEERNRLLFKFNQTAGDYPGNKTIPQLFEEQVEKKPDTIAVWTSLDSQPGHHLDYLSLSSKANQLAHKLRDKGGTAESIVGIMVEHPLEKAVCILGVLKAGAAFLPIEPAYPGKLKTHIYRESMMQFLVTEHSFVETLQDGFSSSQVILIDDESLALNSTANPDIVNIPSDLAYVIFTSGTTGKPKGTLVEHRGVVNYTHWRIQTYQYSERDVTLQLLSYCFDGFGSNFYSSLLSGGTLIIVPDSRKLDYQYIKEIVRQKKVTNMSLVPQMYQALLDSAAKEDLRSLRFVVLAGDKSGVKLIEQSKEKIPHLLLLNEYGPTETTVTATGRSNLDELSTAVIGRPIFNTHIYILDPSLKPVPTNVPGELCIAGTGVARGYLNKPELTDQQFIEASFIKGERIYRTGDLARWLPDGNIELLGRIDLQVKIRGFRIEPGEIENRLLKQERVKETLVLAKEDEKGDKYLCAYIVPEQGFDASELRGALSSQLPDYMIPSYFVLLEEFPLTSNGKVDRKALPEPGVRVDGPGITGSTSAVEYVEPGNEKEEKLMEIWKHVLGRDQIGIKNNFFDLGGDSIKAIQISARMNKAGYKVEVRDIFQNPNISALAPLVTKTGQIADQSTVTGNIPFTPIQRWFFQSKFVEKHHFNQAVMLHFKKEAGNIEDAIKSIFLKLQQHHDVFRMTYNEADDELVQTCHSAIPPLSLQVCDLRDQKDKSEVLKVIESRANEIQAGFDLEKGPLVKLGLFRLADGNRLLIVIHHLVIDGVSWRILFEDIQSLYQQWEKEEALVLPSKTDSFKRWSEQLSQYANSTLFLKEKKFWADLESKQIPLLKTDFEIEENYIKDAETLSFHLDENETDLLLTRVNRAFGTEINDILLTALGLGVKETLACNRLLIALEGHGREKIFNDIDTTRTIGWFTSEYPVLLDFSYEGDLSRLIKETKETLHQVPNKGIGYGILKYMTAGEYKEEIDFKLKPQIGFNYLGQFGPELKEAPFGLARESTGNVLSSREKREHALEVLGIIVNNRLKMSVSYNKKQYKPGTIKAMLVHYKTNLSWIISYCSSRKEIEHTPCDLTYKGLNIDTLQQLEKRYQVDDIYTLSPMQEGIFFHSLDKKNVSAYFVQTSYRFHGRLDIPLLEKSLNEIFRRHETLRAAFVYNDVDRPIQVIQRNRKADFYYKDVRLLTQGNKNEILQWVAHTKEIDRRRSFDPGKDVLLRLAVLQVGHSQYEFIWNFHHIIMDGWCMGVIYKELFQVYWALKENKPLKMESTVLYGNYLQWLESRDKKAGITYWQQLLDGYGKLASLPKFLEPREPPKYERAEVHFTIDEKFTRKLTKLASDEQVTVNTVIQTMWGILLQRYNNTDDVVFGTVVAGRPPEVEGIERMIGLFVNTIPIRIKAGVGHSFSQLVQKVQQQTIMSRPFEYLQLAEIQSKSQLKGNLLDHILGFENYPIQEELRQVNKEHEREFKIENVANVEQSNYDFNIVVIPGSSMEIAFMFNSSVYAKEHALGFASHFRGLFAQLLEDPSIVMREIEILNLEEKEQLLLEFNATKTNYPKDRTLHQLFEEQVDKTPHKTAILDAKKRLTYKELDNSANGLAWILKAKGVQRGTAVSIMLQRSTEMIIALLGILKAGGSYVPIDIESPRDRIVSLLNDCNTSLLITDTASMGEHSFTALQRLHTSRAVVHKTAPRPAILDLNQLPVTDRSLVDYEKYNRYPGEAMVKNCISLQATRGCPYSCLYCHKIWPKHHVTRSAENIFEEVRLYYNMGVRRFAMIDDIFNLDIKNSSRFFQMVIKNNLDIQILFPGGVRGDILTKDYIDLMIQAGTINIALALETASPRLQKLLKKNLNIDKLRENMAYFCETYPHVLTELYLMLGFPTETEEEAAMTLNYLKDLKWVHFPLLNILKIYPGTEMAQLALENGISRDAIAESELLAYHEIPSTLPFDGSFARMFQADFVNNYLLSRERLLNLLPHQMNLLTQSEIIGKYSAYLATEVNDFDQLLQSVGISAGELEGAECRDEASIAVPHLDKKIKAHFSASNTYRENQSAETLNILYLDLSQSFSHEAHQLNELVEAPLGLMCLQTYVQQQLAGKTKGRIAKSLIDFDNYTALKELLEQFKPDIIAIRTLSFYKDFFHKTVAKIREWGIKVPVITGGPYATTSWKSVLQDRHVDVVVLGEGEITFSHLAAKILENKGKLPKQEELEKIAGIAFIPEKEKYRHSLGSEIILLDDTDRLLARESRQRPENINQPDDPIYCIFTSGSTGRPKGVIVEHRNVVRLVKNTNYIKLSENDKILPTGALEFDASTFEIWGGLLNGSTLYLLKRKQILDAGKLRKAMSEYGINLMWMSSPLFNQMSDADIDIFKDVKNLVVGGDVLSPPHINRLRRRFPDLNVTNGYGPTENTTFSLTYHVVANHQHNIPIGKPISNSTAYILDKYHCLVPVGAAGELFLGGDGLARGYMNNPILTKKKFLDNPLLSGQRMYSTGDLARWLPNGNIEFLGRIDQQVKIRGYRVELVEIKSQLMKWERVKNAIVTLKGNGSGDNTNREKQICAYIVSNNGNLPAPELKNYLAKKLPKFMIPAYFVQLDEVPLNPSGKIDFNLLPHPLAKNVRPSCDPKDEIETKLVQIWAEILGLEKETIDIDDDFFDLGGHSLMSINLIARMHKEFNVDIPVIEVFQAPTIRELSQYIKDAEKECFAPIKAVQEREYYPLSQAQLRMYAQYQMDPGLTNYNVPIFMVLEGEVDVQRVEKTFKMLIERHESLRTGFEVMDENVVQRIREHVEFNIEYFDDSADEAQVVNNFVQAFDLSRPPLLRIKLLKTGVKRHILMTDMHHIITDGSSMRVFVKEFMSLYDGIRLPGLPLQYKDYTLWQKDFNRSEKIKRQGEFWLKQLNGQLSMLKLPTDFTRPEKSSFAGGHLHFSPDREVSLALKKMAADAGATLYIVLLTVFNIFLSKLSGDEDIVIISGVAGRRHPDLGSIIGMFVNTMFLRNYPEIHKSFWEFLAEVKERTLDAFENQDYPFVDLVRQIMKGRDVNRNPLGNVAFGVQNIEIPELKIPGLTLKPYEYEHRISRYDLVMAVEENREDLVFALEYNTDIFLHKSIQRFVDVLKEIMDIVIKNKDIKLKDIRISHGLFDQQISNPGMQFNF